MQENTDRISAAPPRRSSTSAWCISRLQSTELALETGLRRDQIIISCKVSRPRDLIAIYRDSLVRPISRCISGLTEAGMGTKGLVWSASAMGVLLNEGIGDTIRGLAHAAPRRRSPRRGLRRMRAVQALGLRSFSPSVTACPGAAGRPARRSRSSPSGHRTTSAAECRNGRCGTKVSRR
jgi:(E)-4-hydroxy-3-methylbut-2-enyl-diphosphate synthase